MLRTYLQRETSKQHVRKPHNVLITAILLQSAVRPIHGYLAQLWVITKEMTEIKHVLLSHGVTLEDTTCTLT
jgi:hypothetical protein